MKIKSVFLKDLRSFFVKKISYTENWQQQHWRTLVSAYKNSPYFDFFEHEFKPFYETQYEYLFDYNLQLLETILKILRVKKTILFTDEYGTKHKGYKSLIRCCF